MAKLVRDNIIEIIKSEGKNPKFKILNQKDYIKELNRKLIEESIEVVNSKN